ncbi:MAG: murein L,D-transpeptidase catalytic domain-containing protein [Chitinophagaceae bacterium]
MRLYHLLLIVILLLSCFAWLPGHLPRHQPRSGPGAIPEKKTLPVFSKKLAGKAAEAKRFATQNGYNERLCFLVSMSLPSGQNRFFVYDLKNDTVLNEGLVTHGRCNENWLEGRKYGNTPGCGCTSLGKYRIGYSYTGRFGLAYKLYGLESTNDKAFSRFVVLHSHDCVPDAATGDEICQSDGCPTVGPAFLRYLKPIIDRSEKPVLLWIFE